MSTSLAAAPSVPKAAEAALSYLAAGLAVIPVWWTGEDGSCGCPRGPACTSAGKHPIEHSWQQGPPPSRADVWAWWETYPQANVGIRTGAVSGNVFVLDIDRGGQESFAATIRANGGLPPTRLHQTGSGVGRHYFYRAPEGLSVPNSVGRIAAAVDVRGDGGMVVAPPSTSGKGRYEVLHEAPVAPAPDWLLNLVARPSSHVSLTKAPPAAPKNPTQTAAQARLERTNIGEALELLRSKRDTPWVEGASWDQTCFEVACKLIEHVNSSWTRITFDEAFDAYMEAAPRDEVWDERRKCWQSAVAKTAGQGRTPPHEDVPLESMATTRPPVREASPAAAPPQDTSSMGDQHSGQIRMAFRLAEAYRGRLIHVTGIGWHHYDGQRWAEDERGYAHRAVIDVLEQALIESLTEPQLRKDVEKCESSGGVEGILKIASKLPQFAMTSDDLDRNPALLNCANGTLDLDTMILRPHDPADLLTKVTRGAYSPGEQAQEWNEFLAEMMPDPLERAYLQRVVGQSLYGRVEEHLLPLMIGTGANGKGVFYGTALHAIGDYGIVVAPEMLLAKDRDRIPTEIMELRGARLAVASETNEGRSLDEATMKRLTGGDRLTARRLYKDPVSFIPTHTLLYVTNDLPQVRADSPSVWRRLRVVPWEIVVPKERQDAHLPRRLEARADAVLAWMVEGYVNYRKVGMSEPPRVLAATDRYQASADPVRRFVEEACFVSPAAASQTRELYAAWQAWARADDAPPMSEKAFAQRLDKLGFPASGRTKFGVTRMGLVPLTTDDGPTDVTSMAAGR